MSDLMLAEHPAACNCPGCGGGIDDPDAMSLDPSAGQTYAGKPIWNITTVESNLNRSGWDWYTNNYGELNDGVLNYGFWLNYEELANSYYVNATGTIAFDEAFYAEDFSPFTAGQQAITRASVGLWDELVSISFRETKSGNADLTYANTFTGGAQAYAYLPFGNIFDSFYEENGDFEDVGRLSGDVWIDGFVASNFFPLADSYYAKLTMIHETGHSLGLSHPGDYDALDDDDGDGVPDPITYANDAAYAQDSLQYSVMSYFDAYETGAQHIDWSLLNFGYAATPLIHDIAAIQAIYGADTTTRTGNTVYGFNSTAGRAEYDFTQNKRPIVAVWDAGGTDTLDFSGWNTPSTIDLNEGAFSSGGGITEFLTLEQVNANRAALGFAPRSQATYEFYEELRAQLELESPLFTDNISIAYGAIIENAIGGGGNDRLVGNQVNNVLTGKGGADLFEIRNAGVSGSDRIADFGRSDVLAVNKTLVDNNNDGIITWSGTLTVDPSDGDKVTFTGLSGSSGLRLLGSEDGLTYYGASTARPIAKSGQKVFESKIGNDTLNGSSSATVRDVFFFDTGNAAPGQGNDRVNLTTRDILVTTTKIADNNDDGVIQFGSSLGLAGNGGSVQLTNGTAALSSIEYDGSLTKNGVTYYVYSNIGSTAGLADLSV
ncbi:M10 family metallopeptidase [Sphingomonas sp.]|jgi:hypothetical protein|uniref:M10 family metallopeptidase n=1 Tax=Sphingomonas sp. TaxID=28214 RepID=UPI002EDB8BE8